MFLIILYKVKSESEVAQSRPTVCNPMDCSLPGSSVHGILQARILEWIAIPLPRDLPDPGIKSRSPSFQADSLPSEPLGNPILYRIYAGGKHSMLRTYQMSINTRQSRKSHIKGTCYHRKAALLCSQGSGCSAVHMKGTGQSS